MRDARAMVVISAAMIAGWFGMSIAAYVLGDDMQQQMAQKVWEMLITLVIGFWFGSSVGSRMKDRPPHDEGDE
jgi:hypothetical protein